MKRWKPEDIEGLIKKGRVIHRGGKNPRASIERLISSHDGVNSPLTNPKDLGNIDKPLNRKYEPSRKERIKANRKGRPKLGVDYMKIVLYGVSFDWNKVLGIAAKSPKALEGYKRKQIELILLQVKGLPYCDFKARYVYTHFEPNRKKDPGNLAGVEKLVGDALQEAGIILNDGWGQVGEIVHKFFVDKTDPRLEVELFGIF